MDYLGLVGNIASILGWIGFMWQTIRGRITREQLEAEIGAYVAACHFPQMRHEMDALAETAERSEWGAARTHLDTAIHGIVIVQGRLRKCNSWALRPARKKVAEAQSILAELRPSFTQYSRDQSGSVLARGHERRLRKAFNCLDDAYGSLSIGAIDGQETDAHQ